jgi:hypothetical protein
VKIVSIYRHMSANIHKKKRTYYKHSGNLSSASKKKTYLLRYEGDPGDYLQEGPFYSKEIAVEKLNLLLKAGVCSWLVSYNG